MKLGTKLTLSLSLIIVLVLSGYGYFHIQSRRDIYVRKMKVEVRSTGQTLKVSLEKISLTREMEYVQDLIDAVGEYERILGVVVYHQGKDLVFRSSSIEEGIEPFIERIKMSIRDDLHQETFENYRRFSVFSYTFPLKDRKGRNIGGVAILQHTSFMEEEILKAKWDIFITLFILIGGTVALILFTTRKWITQPISNLMGGIQTLASGHLDSPIALQGKDELSELARAFNQMAVDLKQAQERILQEAEAKLELERNLRQSEKLATIGQLASGLAHEIGTPLNIISGRVELTQRRFVDSEAKRNLEIILQQTERITKIIQQLLGYVRKKKPEQRPLDLGHLLKTTVGFLGHQIQKQMVTVVEEIEDPLPPMVGDPDQLQQVFLNLMINALQAMPHGGMLRLSASSRWTSKEGLEDGPRPYVEVGIGDSGAGIDKMVVKNIFNPFYTTKNGGTGLGLTITQGIIQDHEGWIDVESEIGKGALFKVYLPCFLEELKREASGV